MKPEVIAKPRHHVIVVSGVGIRSSKKKKNAIENYRIIYGEIIV